MIARHRLELGQLAVEEGVRHLVLAAVGAGARHSGSSKSVKPLEHRGLVGVRASSRRLTELKAPSRSESVASVFSGIQAMPKRRLSGMMSPGPRA